MVKRMLALAVVASLSSCRTMPPRETGFLNRTVTVHGREYPYTVYVPRDFDPARKWPVILFLHGSGERGIEGLPPSQVGLGTAIRFNPSRVPAIVVFPQAPEETRWIDEPADAAMAALDRETKEFNGDRARTYLTGMSMGGYGTIHLALAHPDRFAGLVIICGGLVPHPNTTAVQRSPLIPENAEPYAYVAQALRAIPIWLFHGADDPVIPAEESRRLFDELKKLRANVRYTEYPGVGHNAWDRAYGEAELWPWLLGQKR
jgi:predicted peptidase